MPKKTPESIDYSKKFPFHKQWLMENCINSNKVGSPLMAKNDELKTNIWK